MEALKDADKIPSGFVQLSSGILIGQDSPALARIIKQYLQRKAAAARNKKPVGFVVRGFSSK